MASSQNQGVTPLLTGSKLYFSKKAVRLGNAVYLIRNITGFRVTEAQITETTRNKKGVPFEVLICMYVAALFFLIKESERIWLIVIVTMIILALGYNFFIPKTIKVITTQYLIEVSFISGDKANLLLTSGKNITSEKLLEEVVSELYKILDSNEEKTYVINIEDNSINVDQSGSSIGIGYSGSISVRQVGGKIYNENNN
ncbi:MULTISPECIES: hypothetical protein [unclassified Microcoleus]|jgi:hypothetical protein|uniref:hypothetical protein n=1 Tax=unclassified Microcoleus TaxID=2642155 RepID=UPI001D96112A|nr:MULTISPECIES: hypothetical protein [unclassified Microcoleus]MCC3507295.1 hypothetical protein [Microcoleus sp. PH2017_19_SFW_U_A]TAF85822.1 MAG: hypothetical protein EAZ49_25400 [Oscillatoriales cyanobacterium]MCC3451028.1 hypothetical protein [Microcoleus sp. PH2017_09_SFU_O_A]MCC3475310.1 hypothetical protein [Microcoleus sp. PH2017_13_LAR_U_A]MCC3487816.1 hypothetical protein [Microcoleus sp. PH2017_14_LAR_D_A]